MFRNEALAAEAKAVSEIAMDVSEVLMKLDLPEGAPKGLKIAYHAACSLAARAADQDLSQGPPETGRLQGERAVDSHLCCGSAGTYNLMQPEISGQLKARKVETLEMTKPDIIAAGNIGCMMQIGSGTEIPIVHTVELLDWATGGPRPPALDAPGKREVPVPILR
jgi:glycolate oxidase iron-sulfur subunit